MDNSRETFLGLLLACAAIGSTDALADSLQNATLTADVYLSTSSITCRDNTTIVTNGYDLIVEADSLINEGACQIFSFTGPATETQNGRSAGTVWIKARSVSGTGTVTIVNTGQNGAPVESRSCATAGSGGDGGLVVIDVPDASPVKIIVASVAGGAPGTSPRTHELALLQPSDAPKTTTGCTEQKPYDHHGTASPRRGEDGTVLRASNR